MFENETTVTSSNYECMYVKLGSTDHSIYTDENFESETHLLEHKNNVFEVLYEYDNSQKVAIKHQKHVYFTYKNDVIPMLFSEYDLHANHIELIFYDNGWFSYEVGSDSEESIDITNEWQLIANHFKILNVLQMEKYAISIKKLLDDNIHARESLSQLSKEKEKILKRYLNLRKSKLGQIQVKLWEFRS
ncbi:hypothetical protein [Staphylococcus canis]|uniref:Uncharacterized protein n=1 Tax=Staphylococcus canis TaxID=2724942 RepID=A0ABS0T9J0_9STAP|nr:hypothetical protein [Staphylococcus canis]MBI5975391.1 hypothetical protein [Staphylococcus canis]